jgi:hypothetical protein
MPRCFVYRPATDAVHDLSNFILSLASPLTILCGQGRHCQDKDSLLGSKGT